jgi:NTP pyrophosphatase (non-canonical NTP hydrolase)
MAINVGTVIVDVLTLQGNKAAIINRLAEEVHKNNKKWWIDIHTGEPLKRNVGEMLMLVVSELAEAMEGHRKGLNDTHLVDRPMIEAELADVIIRVFDIAAGLGLDLGGAYVEKMKFNQTRKDHQVEARLAVGGKAY